MPRKRNRKRVKVKQTKEQKRNRDAERKRKQRSRLTEEERTLQRVQAAVRKRERRSRLTEEEITLKRVQSAEFMRARRARVTEEERTLQRVQAAVRKRERRTRLTDEDRALQRAKDTERNRIRKGLLAKIKSTYDSPKPPEGNSNNNATEIKCSLVDPQQSLQRREQQTTNLPADDSQSEETRNTLSTIQSLKIMVQSLRKATSELIKSTVKATVERVKGITIRPSRSTVRVRSKAGLKVPAMKLFPIRLPNAARGSAANEYVCPVCPEIEGYSKLLTHLRIHTKAELEIAREKLNKDPPGGNTEFTLSMYPCELCPESFFKISKFRKHLVDSHKDNRDLLGKYCYLCSFCDEAYSFKKSLISHERDFHGIYINCPICNESLQTQQLFTEHIIKVHRDCSENEICLQYSEGFVCKMCGYVHQLKRRVMEHFQNTHSLRSLKCDVCDKVFASERSVLSHKRTFHSGKFFFCEKCGKNCKGKKSFDRHVKLHLGNNKQIFKCKECHKIFKSIDSLKNHHKSSHTTETPFQCHICGMAFSLSSSLRHHKVKYCEKDQAEKRTCSVCEKEFDNFLLLSYHKNNIHKYKNTEETVCNRCNKTMTNPQALYTHNNMYHSNRIIKRNLKCICQCQVCEKGFKSRQELFNHWRTHNDERPFKCSLCDATFRSKPNMPQHRKSAHKNDSEKAKVVMDKHMNAMLREKFKRLYPNLEGTEGTTSWDEEAELDTRDVETVGIGADQSATINVANVCELDAEATNGVPEVLLDVTTAVTLADVMEKTTYVDFFRAYVPGEDEVPAAHAVADATGTTQLNTNTINIVEVSEMEMGAPPTVEFYVKESNNVATGTGTAALVMKKTYVDFSRANVPELSKMATNSWGRRKQNLLPFNDVDIMPGQSLRELMEIKMDYNPVLAGDAVGIEHLESPSEIHEAIDFDEFSFTPDSPVSIYFDEEICQDEIKFIIPPPERFPEDPYSKKLIIKLERLKEHTCSTCDFLTYTSENYEKHLSSRAHRIAKRDARSSRFLNTNAEENSLDDAESELSYSSDESSSPDVLSKSPYQRRMVENRIKNIRKPRMYICSFCGEKLDSFTLYKTHLVLHTDEKFRCEICEVKFETSDELTKHCDEIHEGKMPFQCEECPSGFVALYLLVRHRNRRHNFKDDNNERKNHMKQEGTNREKRPFCCSSCSQCFKKKDQLNRHIKRVHHQFKILFSCKICAQAFSTRQHLKEHHEKAHPAEKFKVAFPGRRTKLNYACNICGSEHKDVISMKKHRETHRSRRRKKQKLETINPRNSKVYICSFCGETLKDSKLYKAHLAFHAEEKLKCAFCNLASEFDTSEELAKHCDEIHPGKLPFQCQKCPSGFATQYLLVLHKKLRHSQVNSRKVKTLKPLEQERTKIDKLVGHDPKLTRQFSCSDCSRKFSREFHLNRHIKEVHQKLRKILSCKICGQDFSAPIVLARHHEKVHPGEKFEIPESEEKYMGAICGSEQKDLISINKHREIHYSEHKRKADEKNGGDVKYLEERSKKLLATARRLDEKKYICDICGATNKRLSELRKHLQKHEEGFNVVCTVCPARFLNQRALDLHIGVHDSKRPFRCNQCSYHFKYTSHLKRHILSAHENVTHTCEICSKVFKRQDELRQHNRKVHLEMYNTNTTLVKYVCKRCNVEFSDSKSLTEHRKIHAEADQRYKCPQCANKSYDSQVRLDKHLQLHDSSRPFSCNLCSFFFNHRSNLVLHRKNVHEKMGIDYWSKNNALRREAKKIGADSLIEK